MSNCESCTHVKVCKHIGVFDELKAKLPPDFSFKIVCSEYRYKDIYSRQAEIQAEAQRTYNEWMRMKMKDLLPGELVWL